MMKELPIPSCPITKFSNENPRITSHILTMKYKWELGHSSNKVSSEKKKRVGGRGYISKRILLLFFEKQRSLTKTYFQMFSLISQCMKL